MITHAYWNNKADVVQSVLEELRRLEPNCALTMTIVPEKSGGYSVTFATAASLGDIETRPCLRQPMST